MAWVAVKRLLFGPKRPKWSFKLEFLISMIQSLQDDDTPIQKGMRKKREKRERRERREREEREEREEEREREEKEERRN